MDFYSKNDIYINSSFTVVMDSFLKKILKLQNITVIAIAHRLSTIKNMDRIVVIETGKIVEDDNFVNLLNKNDGKFKEMWSHQINGMIN